MALGLGCAGKSCKLWDLGKSSSVSGKDLGSATFRVSLDPCTTRVKCSPRTQLLGDLSFPNLWWGQELTGVTPFAPAAEG